MANLLPLVVANYGTRPKKGGRKFEGFKLDRYVASVCEVLFRHVALAGFDVTALCSMFEIRAIEVPALLAANGLDSAGTRKLRFLSTPTAWTPLQVQHLLMHWHCQLTVEAIATRLGRSAASVRYKARSLGLPIRDRKTLVLQPPHMLPPLAPIQYRDWNDPDKIRLGEEALRGVNTKSIARRMRRDYRHTEWMMSRVELPGRSAYRNRLTKTVFDPNEPLLEEFRGQGWHFRHCLVTGQGFWSPRNGSRVCAAFKRTKLYRDMVASGVLAYD